MASIESAAGVAPMHAAIVLAAGGSRRLGQAKQLLGIHGQPLLAHVVDLVAATAPARLIVVLGAQSESMRAVLGGRADDSASVLDNVDWHEGMASSLRLAAATLADWSGHCLIVGCDQPRLTGTHLQSLLDAARLQPQRDIASRYTGIVGIPAVVRASTLAQATSLHGDQGLRRLLRDDAMAIDADELAFDIDTPADLAIAIERGWMDRRS